MRARLRLSVRVWTVVPAPILAASAALVASPVAVGWRAQRKSCTFNERIHRGRVEFKPFTALDRGRHGDNAVTRADQSTHHDAQRFEYSPHLAVAPFAQHDAVPVIGRILVAARVFHRLTARNA